MNEPPPPDTGARDPHEPVQPGRIEGREVHHGRIVHLFVDRVRFPDGSQGELEFIRHSGAAAVLPVLPWALGFAEHRAATSEIKVAEVMARDVVSCRPDDSLTRILALMTRHRVRHLPVVDGGRLAGLISIGDAVKHRLDELELEASPRDRLDRLKDEFVLTASHALRSPLTPVQGFAELLMLEHIEQYSGDGGKGSPIGVSPSAMCKEPPLAQRPSNRSRSRPSPSRR